jgi:hypothetical protein
VKKTRQINHRAMLLILSEAKKALVSFESKFAKGAVHFGEFRIWKP